MSWFFLFLAGLLEVAWAVGLKQLNDLNRPWVLPGTVIAFVSSMGLLYLAMKDVPLGTAYAIWTGIGVVGTLIVGVVFLGENLNFLRIFSATLILAGLIGLKVTSQ
jgi:quaternary ammonium compound-resistance protein SugE